MILEHAVLDVVPGQQGNFEGAFREAQGIIVSMPGFRSLRLDRCIESSSRYVLLVEWERLEDHTEGFRRSPDYERWRTLLHHFYRPFPVVEHYHPIVQIGGVAREPDLPASRPCFAEGRQRWARSGSSTCPRTTAVPSDVARR